MHIDGYTARRTARAHPWARLATTIGALVLALGLATACDDDRATNPTTNSTTQTRTTVIQASGAPTTPAVNGRIVFSAPTEGGSLDIFSMNPDGSDRLQLTSGPDDDISPGVSLDGRKIVFARRDATGKEEIYVMNADGSRLRRLTAFGPGGRAYDPAWSPDGRSIAFSGAPAVDNESDIYVMSANGRNVRALTDFGPTDSLEDDGPTWSPDGLRIAFARWGVIKRVMVMNADGSGQQSFSACGANPCQAPSWSPDGTRIAYESISPLDGTAVLEVKAFGQPAQQIATNLRATFGGPAWAPDGTKLVYPGLARIDGFLRATLLAIAPDGTDAQPLVPAGSAGQYPAWGAGR